jgi:hypothetical protein
MKAVLYHAEAHDWHGKGIYKDITYGLKENLATFNIPLIHLTVTGHEGWGDENYYYDVHDVKEVIYNREKTFLEFLKNDAVDDEIYWFCEPDFRLLTEFPPLTTDLCMLHRNDPVVITPAWRLATKAAWPIFEEAFSYFDLEQKKWHGDSVAWVKMWEAMEKPDAPGFYKHNKRTVELRPYGWYASRHKARFSKQFKGGSKDQITSQAYKDSLIPKESGPDGK